MDKIKVLVVEDDKMTSAVIKKALAGLGYIVTGIAVSGEEALASVQQNPPDIVLMDVVLEGAMDGIETAKIITETYAIPVLYLTMYSDEEKLTRAESSHTYAYILKPIVERELHANIRMSLFNWAARQAKRTEAKFNALFNSPSIPFMIINGAGSFLAGNEASDALLRELTGAASEPGEYLRVFPELRTAAAQITSGKNITFESQARGTANRWFEFTLTPVAATDEPGMEIVVEVREITERKAGEERLRESEKSLRDMNTKKDKFFSIIAHDLRSPFNTLLGFSEYLLEDIDILDKETIKSLATQLHKTAKNVFALLENLLQWSRVQSGRIDYSPETIRFADLALELQRLFGPLAAQKVIHLYFEIPDDAVLVADKNMFRSVIQNLLSNAIKFTERGGAIRVHYAKEENGGHVISVKDSGIGIPQSEMETIFDIESNYSTEGTEEEQGTGLGLVLCREFVQKHGGTLTVASAVGEGSTFTVRLPGDIAPAV